MRLKTLPLCVQLCMGVPGIRTQVFSTIQQALESLSQHPVITSLWKEDTLLEFLFDCDNLRASIGLFHI